MLLVTIFITVMGISPNVDFQETAKKYDVPVKVLRSICSYESDKGRVKHFKNKNGTWDVGLCMNHRKKSKKKPKIPPDTHSVREAAKELSHWRNAHTTYCVKHHKKTGKCGSVKYGKFRGIKNCTRKHFWWTHYNHGYRVLTNDYSQKVKCYMDNGNKKCKKNKWKKTKKPKAY